MNKYNWIVCKIFVGLMIVSTGFAENNLDENGHFLPGSRPTTHSDWMEAQQARSDENESTKEITVSEFCSHDEQEAKLHDNPEAAIYNAELYYTSHNGAYHNAIAVAALGSIVELEDGSIWTVADGDRYKTLNWLTSDLIVLTQNHDWFSSFLFRLSNQNTGVSVKCNMTLGPVYNGYYTHWIVAINYYTQEIYLEDGSIWQVTGFDSSLFSKWLMNDTVIIGVNDGFLSSTKPNILINVNTLTYVRATCTW